MCTVFVKESTSESQTCNYSYWQQIYSEYNMISLRFTKVWYDALWILISKFEVRETLFAYARNVGSLWALHINELSANQWQKYNLQSEITFWVAEIPWWIWCAVPYFLLPLLCFISHMCTPTIQWVLQILMTYLVRTSLLVNHEVLTATIS